MLIQKMINKNKIAYKFYINQIGDDQHPIHFRSTSG